MILAPITELSNGVTIGETPSTISNVIALNATSCARLLYAQVRAFVGMALRTMRAAALEFACVSASDVFGMTDKFHVVAVDARPNSTFMIRLQSFWDRAALKKPSGPRVSDLLPIDLKSSVTVVEPARPQPATVFENLDVAHKPIHGAGKCKLIVSHLRRLPFPLHWSGLPQCCSTAATRFYLTPNDYMRPAIDTARGKALEGFHQ